MCDAYSALQGGIALPIESTIDPGSDDFRANAARMRSLADELAKRRAEAAEGGPLRARERHLSRGKLLPRQRVMQLLDPGSPFVELSPLAANGMYDDAIHGAGLITGVGRVEGRECVIVCNDSTIKGGTYYPMTVKKHLRAQEIARENRLPCIYLVDSGGANLPHQTEVFPDREHFGRIFFHPRLGDVGRGLGAQVLVHAALHDAVEQLAGRRVLAAPADAAVEPAVGALHRCLRVVALDVERRAFVERERDVRAEGGLHLHRGLGPHEALAPVEVGAEANALLLDRRRPSTRAARDGA